MASLSLVCCTEDKEIDLYVPVSQIELLDVTLYVDEVIEMTPYFNPEVVTNSTIYWSVDNATPTGCVTIDNKGILTAVEVGIATISATPTGETFAATCNVTVKPTPTPLTAFEINEESIELTVGKSESLSYTSEPETAADFEVVWSLNDVTPAGSIIIDSETGLMMSSEEGSATVVATATDYSGEVFIDECSVTSKAIFATSITIPTELVIEITKDSSISATVEPKDAVQTVKWVVTDGTGSFTIDQLTGVLSGVTAGTATIKAVAIDGSDKESAECTVTIKEATVYTKINLPATATVSVGLTTQIEIESFEPSDYVTDPTVKWSIVEDYEEYASIDEDTGVVTGLKEGTAKVIATAVDASGPVSTECEVAVTAEVEVNLVFHPGFEEYAFTTAGSGWSYWGNYTSEESSSYVISGTRSARFTNANSGQQGALYQLITIPKKNATYKFGMTGRVMATYDVSGAQEDAEGRAVNLTLSANKTTYATLTITSATDTTVEGEIYIDDSYPDQIYIQAIKSYGIAVVDDFYFIKKLGE